jgi:hypothetical protein
MSEEMTDAQVLEALSNAAAADMAAERGEQAPETPPAASAPEGEGVAPEQPAPVAPPVEVAAEVVDSGEQFFNPDALDPALVPGWKQLQAAFTQKTQELAAQRKQFEAFGSPEELQDAVELYGRLSDPSNWVDLRQQLDEAMQEYGLLPTEAGELAPPAAPALPDLDGLDDPELAPLAAAVKAALGQNATLEARLQAFEAERIAAYEAQEEQRAYEARVANVQQQVADLRAANPHYTESDIAQIVKRATAIGDDVAAAAAEHESYWEDRMTRYFQSKQSASAPAVQPIAGAGVSSETVQEPAGWDDTVEGAVEYLRGLQAEGLLDV